MNNKLQKGKEEIVENYKKVGDKINFAEDDTHIEMTNVILKSVIQKLADNNAIDLETARKLKAAAAFYNAKKNLQRNKLKNGVVARNALDDESKIVKKNENKAIKIYLKKAEELEKNLDKQAKNIGKRYKLKKEYGVSVFNQLQRASINYQELLEKTDNQLKYHNTKAKQMYNGAGMLWDEKEMVVLRVINGFNGIRVDSDLKL